MRRGVLLMILAGLVFTVMITSVKVLRQTLHPLDIVVWRSILATPLVYALAGAKLGALPRPGVLVLRAVLGFSAMSCLFTAARGLAISDLSILHKLQPLVVAVAAPWVLGKGERVGTTWGAVVLGFAGAALLIGPELRVGNVHGLWALAGAAFSAAAHLAVRSLGRDHSPFTVVVVFQVSCIPLGTGTLLLLEGRLPVLPSAEHWLPLAIVAVAASLGQLLMTQAYRLDRAAPIAAASYTAPLWGVLADLVWFAEFPGWRVWTGGTVVVAAGLWLVLRRDAQSSQVPNTTASS